MKLQILKIAYVSLAAKLQAEPKTRVILKNCLLYETSNNIISHTMLRSLWISNEITLRPNKCVISVMSQSHQYHSFLMSWLGRLHCCCVLDNKLYHAWHCITLPCNKLNFLNFGCVNKKKSHHHSSQKPARITAAQMRHFHLKHTPDLFFGRPDPLGVLTALPRPPSWALSGRWEGRKGEGKGGERMEA